MFMNRKKLAIATGVTVFLTTSIPVMSQIIKSHNNFVSTNARSVSIVSDNSQVQEQIQETIISLNASELRQPNILRISTTTSATELTGQIKLNGRVIENLRNNKTQINLSPYLTTGRHKIEISAKYTPGNSSVKVEFTGPSTRVNQQTSGSGKLVQTLIIDVL